MSGEDSGSAPSAQSFPLRVAAIDIGSNALRFAAAEFRDDRHPTWLDSARAAVRLGQDVFRTGRLTDHSIALAVEALSDFRGRIDALGVVRHRAVATSAVREAENRGELIEKVRADSGIEIEPITGAEEAQLVWAAIRARMQLGGGEWILIDVGGGSVEISVASAAAFVWSESHAVGTVRMLEQLRAADAQDPVQIRRLLEDAGALARLSSEVLGRTIEGVIATGGNAEALARIAGAERGPGPVRSVLLNDLRDLIDRLAAMDVSARISELGLRPDRADVILPAAIFYEQVTARAGADRFLVPRVGVRDGVLLDLLARG